MLISIIVTITIFIIQDWTVKVVFPALISLENSHSNIIKMFLILLIFAFWLFFFFFCLLPDKRQQVAYLLEKAMAPHSSTLARRIPWTEEPGGLWSMGSLRVGHDWVTSLSIFTFMHWRRKWQPTPVFLPKESQGWGSLVGCHLWGCTESDMTEAT